MSRASKENLHKINKTRLTDDLLKLGVQAGDSLVITAAISKIGQVEEGTQTVLDSLLSAVGHEGSIFGLSFTQLYKLPLNRVNTKTVFDLNTSTYTGSLNNAMIQHPKAVRSRHPSCSVVGIGPRASEILPAHNVSSMAYDPVYKLAQYKNSKMLLLGTVDNCPGVTTVHVAQNLLGMKNRTTGKYGVNYIDEDGNKKLYMNNYVGGCSRGFWKFYDHYRKARAASEGKVGNAHCMLANLKKTLEIDMEILKNDPGFFFCDNPLCYTCRVTWEHSRTPFIVFALRRLISKLMKK